MAVLVAGGSMLLLVVDPALVSVKPHPVVRLTNPTTATALVRNLPDRVGTPCARTTPPRLRRASPDDSTAA
ncbi:hypothetical protein VV01_07560 [Luteipulveratus halotolerans]|uniref:Uncharacterized protein n=1 Tax=Luteipulveratus halotolerans TaxID=1631356 RepID=A0A0L6CGV9_9MICO|nr:hypothetical protein VV01_07560 [Luteipulveratus halotolerans]